MTIATVHCGAAQRLVQRVAPLSLTGMFDGDAVRTLAAQLLPHTEERARVTVVLDIAQALTHLALFENADEHWGHLFIAPGNAERVAQWGHSRAEAWRELAWITACNAVEADELHAAPAA